MGSLYVVTQMQSAKEAVCTLDLSWQRTPFKSELSLSLFSLSLSLFLSLSIYI